MRKIVSGLVALMITGAFTGCSGTPDRGDGHSEAEGPEGWKLIWSDEFDQDQLDRTKWTFDIGNGFTDGNGNYVSGWGNNELEYYTGREDNARVKDGKLIITAVRERFEGFDYTSARLKTKGLFSTTYGRFEFRAKLPAGKGLWPALWLLPEDDKYGGWAASGEIDVMEAKGSIPGMVSGAIHFGGSWPNNTYKDGRYTFPEGTTIEDDHVYALEWEPGAIHWYVDGELVQTQTEWYSRGNQEDGGESPPFPAPFDQPFYMLMNLAVGGNFDGAPDENTVFPARMEVDYVRVYRRE
ncbi:glycoside hydrolase family 16 protein [Paenibacillus tarimensis]